MRSFDPRRVGRLECATWVTYYRREWLKFLVAALEITRHAFALSWPATLRGAWLVLRASQLWTPYPNNDPDGARRCMRGFSCAPTRRYSPPSTAPEAAARVNVPASARTCAANSGGSTTVKSTPMSAT